MTTGIRTAACFSAAESQRPRIRACLLCATTFAGPRTRLPTSERFESIPSFLRKMDPLKLEYCTRCRDKWFTMDLKDTICHMCYFRDTKDRKPNLMIESNRRNDNCPITRANGPIPVQKSSTSLLMSGQCTPSSSTRILVLETLRRKWTQIDRAKGIKPGSLKVKCVLGQTGIIGNERADALAKQVCSMVTSRTAITIARARMKLDENYRLGSTKYWNSHAPGRNRDLEIEMAYRTYPEPFLLPRRTKRLLFAARSRHGDFAANHRRLKHTDAELYCFCVQEEKSVHLISVNSLGEITADIETLGHENSRYCKIDSKHNSRCESLSLKVWWDQHKEVTTVNKHLIQKKKKINYSYLYTYVFTVAWEISIQLSMT
ncbi:hypothetical protein GcC1_094035 [Golovinomyces cichoracearum]|uniref:RNase H type-1 domain-containing protein n=1 Tax=Golovinomyces cichoracearum TaxID=62708 RepID=A0A420ID99_9PEZI|nr:hypothetical protein GcC1_094035 [Golovinomyces cichoracearum]